MEVLISLALKSLLFAAATLLVLKLMSKRSAADRSWIAHLGLAAIAVLPLAWLLLPQLEVATSLVEPEPVAQAAPVAAPVAAEVDAPAATFPGAASTAPADPGPLATVDWAFWAYALPAGILILLTLIALGRLVVLQAKASVLVEPNWLTALAKAQRRMGFKHGTALLTSDDLSSPISWGLMRPVILLNSEAAEAHAEAEAIIAHELAHVARLDWIKLLLSRFTVALFWFNPLVWLLAREAHQLREEAADDAVLASNIEDTEYARLLVGIARHECRGLLIGAHGVAPAKNSLTRRVQRVLDAALARAPGGWRWTAAAGFFAAGMAVPLAVLQFVPTTPAGAASVATVGGKARAIDNPLVMTARGPGGTATTYADGTMIAVDNEGRSVRLNADHDLDIDEDIDPRLDADHDFDLDIDSKVASAISAQGNARAIALANGTAAKAVSDARRARASAGHDQTIAMAALGINRAYVREMEAAGLGKLGTDELMQLKALGVDATYIAALGKAGMSRLSVDDLTQMRAIGVTAKDVGRYRQSFGHLPSVDQITEMKALGVDPGEVGPDHEP